MEAVVVFEIETSELLQRRIQANIVTPTTITTRLKKTSLTMLLLLVKAVIVIGSALKIIVEKIIILPIKILASFIFRKFLVHLYRGYLVLKRWLVKIFAPAKNRIIYPLLNRSTIHFVLIMIAVAVVLNNFFVKETKAEEFGQQTILNSLITNIEDVDIVETALTSNVQTADFNRMNGIISAASNTQSNAPASDLAQSNIVTTVSSAALVKPTLSSTAIGERPRDTVEYYIVEGGDTISTIAEKFKLSINSILWENKLGPRDYIKPGDRLTILPLSGISHQVKKGDSIDTIAKKYGVAANDILEFNQLADASAIEIDQILIVPGGAMPEPPAPKYTAPTSSYGIFNIPPSSSNIGGAKLTWPTPGHRINQYFKWRHTGIDIDGDYSSPIYAADDGRVEYASSDRSGYGLHIIINHGGGIKTLYGHESKLFVKVGDSVTRGQTIGMMGCTGRCTGTHVHFEVIVNGTKVNPLPYTQ